MLGKIRKQFRFDTVALFSSIVMVSLLTGALFLFIQAEEKNIQKAHADTYYADALGRRQTDTCNRVRINISESPSCPRLTTNFPTCTAYAGPSTNTSSYAFNVQISSNDGAAHNVAYETASNFCNNGRMTGGFGGYCSCTDNGIGTNTSIAIPANGSRTVTVNRANPYGQTCGSYQLDFWINGVDGNNGCTLGDVAIVGASGICETGNTCTPPATFSISGSVFSDVDKDKIKDGTETNYNGGITITSTNSGGANSGNIATSNGGFTVSNLNPGTYTISYNSIPNGYIMTNPLNGPPPSFQVTVGGACNTNGALGASCSGGNISGLNFAITNSFPWIRAACGDIRMDNGVTNTAPSGQSMITTNASCTNPGVVFTGDTAANFGQGQASSSNQVVGGTNYPEVYDESNTNDLFSSYTNLLGKAQAAGITPINLTTVCTLSNCTLPANLPHGIYQANGNVALNAYTFPVNQNYVFLINGTLTIRGNILVPSGANSSVLFAAADNIIVPATVGSAALTTTPNLSGIYSTDDSVVLQSTNACNDLRLNLEGTLIVNADRNGGSLQNSRDLCGNNPTAPTMQITQRLDFVLNLPDFLRSQQITSKEVAP